MKQIARTRSIQARANITLGVGVDEQHLLTAQRQADGDVNGSGRFTRAALLINHGQAEPSPLFKPGATLATKGLLVVNLPDELGIKTLTACITITRAIG
jgi:hypothetical protein